MPVAYKYAFEGYDDWVHRRGYFKGYKLFFPAPYNFCIFALGTKINYMKRQDKIDDFSDNLFGFNPKIIEIEVPEEDIKKYEKNLLTEEALQAERLAFLQDFEQYKDNHEKSLEADSASHELFDDGHYELAAAKWHLCMVLNPDFKASCLYNIACCRSRLGDKEGTISFLQQASDAGFVKWSKVVSDRDLDTFKDEPEFVIIIQQMLLKNPIKDELRYCRTYKQPDGTYKDGVDVYLEKHGIKAAQAPAEVGLKTRLLCW